jgi:hypothetical protein
MLSYPDLAHETFWQCSRVDMLSVVRELQYVRVEFSSVRMILFDSESRVECNAEPRGQLRVFWLLRSAVGLKWSIVCIGAILSR